MKKFFVMTAFLLATAAGFNASADEFEGGIQDITEEEALQLADLGLDIGIQIGRVYECKAQNLRGMVFKAQAQNKYRAQDLAVRKCYNFGSRQCNLIGCKGKWSVGVGPDRDDRWDRDGGWGRGRDDRDRDHGRGRGRGPGRGRGGR